MNLNHLFNLTITLVILTCTIVQAQEILHSEEKERIAVQLLDTNGNPVEGPINIGGPPKQELIQTCHSNGQLKSETQYYNGKKEGTHKVWSDAGILLVEENYKNGKANGLTQWFHEGGHLAGKGQMVDGVRQGPWKICDIEENGFCIDANFVNGKREGIWKIYHDKTQTSVWKEQTFKKNQVVAERCFDLEGKVIVCE